MDLNKHIVSDANKFDNFIKQFCLDEANNYFIPNIKKVILDNYDSYLIGNVVDKNSRTNPINYRDEFLSALNNFNFIVDNDFKKSFRNFSSDDYYSKRNLIFPIHFLKAENFVKYLNEKEKPKKQFEAPDLDKFRQWEENK